MTVIGELRKREKEVGYTQAHSELMCVLAESMATDAGVFLSFFEKMTEHQRDCMQTTVFKVATKPEGQHEYARAVANELSNDQLQLVFALAAFGIKQIEIVELAEDLMKRKAREEKERAERN